MLRLRKVKLLSEPETPRRVVYRDGGYPDCLRDALLDLQICTQRHASNYTISSWMVRERLQRHYHWKLRLPVGHSPKEGSMVPSGWWRGSRIRNQVWLAVVPTRYIGAKRSKVGLLRECLLPCRLRNVFIGGYVDGVRRGRRQRGSNNSKADMEHILDN